MRWAVIEESHAINASRVCDARGKDEHSDSSVNTLQIGAGGTLERIPLMAVCPACGAPPATVPPHEN